MKQPIVIILSIFSIYLAHSQKIGIGTTNPVNRLTVAGSADIMDSLGIGTPSPAKRLEVIGDANINGLTVGLGGGNIGNNTAFGANGGISNTTGQRNAAIGLISLPANTTGTDNTAIGAYSLNANVGGSFNTGVGFTSNGANVSGSSNTTIGFFANLGSNNLTNATAIGANAAVNTSNSLVLGNNANVGIGTSAPTEKLEVVGTTKTTSLQITAGAMNNYLLKSDASGNATWADFSLIESDPKVGALTTSRLPRWNGSSLVDGIIHDPNTGQIGIGTTVTSFTLNVTGPSDGIRLLSGDAGNYTSFRMGRATTEALWGIASGPGHFVIGADAGDIIFRTETLNQNILFNNGSGVAPLVLDDGKIGLGLGSVSPINTVDVEGNLAVGAAYAGVIAAPANGAIIQGITGIGTSSPLANSMLTAATNTDKTWSSESTMATFATNEPTTPSGIRLSVVGAATLENREVRIQAMDLLTSNFSNLHLQPDGGAVGVRVVSPEADVALDVGSGLGTKYGGTYTKTYYYADPLCIATPAFDETFDLPWALPSGWNHYNTIVMTQVRAGQAVLIERAKLLDNGTQIQLKFKHENAPCLGAGNTTVYINYVLFRS